MWTGRGTQAWPRRDETVLVEAFGESRARDLMQAIRSLEADFNTSDAHLTVIADQEGNRGIACVDVPAATTS